MISNLPRLPVNDRGERFRLRGFSGLDRRAGAAPGGLRWTENLCSDAAPLLSTRAPRYALSSLAGSDFFAGTANGIYAANRLFIAAGSCLLVSEAGFSAYPSLAATDLEDSRKCFCALGERLLIWPDKKIWTAAEGLQSLEASYSGEGLVFSDGTYAGEPAEANSISTPGAAFPFRVGDAVTVSGCTAATGTENNRTAVIREISGDGRTLRFYENTFAGTGTERGTVTLTRSVPDLDYVCTNENRVWGCKGDTVWCSKLGDPFNWNVFDGVSTDAWSVESGTPGCFTGCVSYLGYPCFFKEDRIFKVYGSRPSNFELMGSAALGVLPGAAGTLAVAGESLFYLSRAGFVAYGGGTAQTVGGALEGLTVTSGAAGSDGVKYYVSALCQDDRLSAGREFWALLVYDTRSGSWYREDDLRAEGMAWFSGGLWAQSWSQNGCGVLLLSGKERVTGGAPKLMAKERSGVRAAAELGDYDLDGLGGKYPLRLRLRFQEFPEGSQAAVSVSFDSGVWESLCTVFPESRRSSVPEADIRENGIVFLPAPAGTVYVPFPVRRCDRFALRLSFYSSRCRLSELSLEVRAEDSARK